jgi:hypothetical protein
MGGLVRLPAQLGWIRAYHGGGRGIGASRAISDFFRHASHDSLMKRSLPAAKEHPFKGSLRHYHRSNTHSHQAWDSWVDGKSASSKKYPWWKIGIVCMAVLGLGAIIIGLVVELG